jgi:hypothetical protein
VNTHFRRIEIGRLTTKNLLTQYTRQPFEGLSGDIVLKNQMRRAKHINWNKVDIQPFIELSEEYPNLIYILYPRFHGDKHFLRADRRFRTLFLTSGLPCINLTHALPDNSLFDDAWHASPAGNSVIRRHIRYAMDRSPVYQGSR